MATLFSDSFTRADSSTIGNGWTEVAGGGDWRILGGAVNDPVSSGASLLIQSAGPGVADYAVQAAITQGDLPVSTAGGVGLVGRYLDPSNGYLVWIDKGSGAPTMTYYLYRIVSGTLTELGNWTTAVLADPVTLRLEMQGSALRVLVNGTQRISATDSSLTAAGQFGLRVFSGTTIQNALFDDVLVQSFGGTTFSLSGSTTQATAVSLKRAVSLTRTVSQAQAALAVGIARGAPQPPFQAVFIG